MKWKIAPVISILILSSLTLNAQRGGFPGLGRLAGSAIRHGGGFSHHGGGRWNRDRRFGEHDRYGNSGWSTSCSLCAGWYSDYWPYEGGGYGYQSNTVVLVPVPQVNEPPAPPPPPVSSALHEYSWPASGGDSGSAFVIASKDGTVQRAIIVWIQDDRLCLITPDGVGRQLPLSDIDRQTTGRLNAELKLTLTLPFQYSGAAQPASN